MSKQSRYIQVFEHESIFTYPNEDGVFITNEQFEQLCAYNDKHGNKYFTVLRRGIRFKQYVGVIQIGRTTIEILPKTDDRDTQFWHKILFKLLAECRKVKLESVSQAVLRKREHSLLDLYIEMYLDEVEKLVHQGLTKKYHRSQNQVKSLNGKLLFTSHIRKNLVHKERFYTEHTIYTSDNIYNQIVRCGLRVVSKLKCSSYLKDRAMGLEVHFQHISDKISITDTTFNRLVLSRNTKKYKEAIQIARLLILNYSPDIKSGSEDLLAILFNMNDLWEEYIYRQLLKSKSVEAEVIPQQRNKFWENKEIKPDIVIKKDGEVYIVDTKWKVLDQVTPSDEDLKQMFAYNLYWTSYKSILLYPKTTMSPIDKYGKYHRGMDKAHGCTLGFVDLLTTEGELNRNCSDHIWKLIDEKD